MSQTRYTSKVKDPKSQGRRYERIKGPAPDWEPDPIETSNNFFVQYGFRLALILLVLIVSLFALFWLPRELFANHIRESKDVAGSLIIIALSLAGVGIGIFLPVRWHKQHKQLLAFQQESKQLDAPPDDVP